MRLETKAAAFFFFRALGAGCTNMISWKTETATDGYSGVSSAYFPPFSYAHTSSSLRCPFFFLPGCYNAVCGGRVAACREKTISRRRSCQASRSPNIRHIPSSHGTLHARHFVEINISIRIGMIIRKRHSTKEAMWRFHDYLSRRFLFPFTDLGVTPVSEGKGPLFSVSWRVRYNLLNV